MEPDPRVGSLLVYFIASVMSLLQKWRDISETFPLIVFLFGILFFLRVHVVWHFIETFTLRINWLVESFYMLVSLYNSFPKLP